MAGRKQITPAHWAMIVDAIRGRRCVPFLGAAANVTSAEHTYDGLPLGGEVALAMVGRLLQWQGKKADELARVEINGPMKGSELEPDLTRTRLMDLPRVSLHFREQTDDPTVLALLTQLLEPAGVAPSPILRTLAALPLRLIVTTNYDRLMEKALDGKQPFYVVDQPVKGFKPEDQPIVQARLAEFDGVVVYKIHGSIDSNGPPKPVVISEDDYIDLLTVLDSPQGIPRMITEKLADATLLFLGYGLEDWDFRTLFRGVIERLAPHMRRKAFALQRNPPQFWVDYWADKGVEIYDVDIYQFAKDLAAKCPEFFAQPRGPAAQVGL